MSASSAGTHARIVNITKAGVGSPSPAAWVIPLEMTRDLEERNRNTIALEGSEERARLFIEAVRDYAIFMLDPDGNVITWNVGAERIKGYKASEIVGRHFSCFYSREDVRAGKPLRGLRIATTEGRFAEEDWRIRKDGSRFWASVTITAIRAKDGRLVGFGKVTRDLTERKLREEALRQSEERFRLLVENVKDYAIFMLNPDGGIASWNAGAQQINGYEASEIVGRHFSCLYLEEDVRGGKPARELEVAAREGRFEDEGWRLRKDGSTFWANVIITAIRDRSGSLVGFAKITGDFTQRMLARKALEDSERELKASEKSLRHLSLHLLRTQDEERRLIGREMHDSLGQFLSVLKMKLDAIRASSDGNGSAATKQQVADCAALVDSCVKEVRTVSYLLYPPMLEELGLKSAILWYLDGFSRRSGIKTSFEIADDFERISQDAELVLFRVLQESLTNVHKHSESATAQVRVTAAGEALTLEVTDQGKGLPPETLEHADQDWMGSMGVGLRGMAERLRQLGGVLEVRSTEPGTQVRATVPLRTVSRASGA